MSAALLLALTVAAAPAAAVDCDALQTEAEAIARMNRSDATGGVERARAGRERAREAGCTVAEAEMTAALGDNLDVSGDNRGAQAAYADARALLEPLGPSVELASVLRREGISHASTGDLTGAVEVMLASQRMAESLGDRNEAAMSAGNLASLYSRLGEFARARENFELAYQGFLETGNRVSAAGTGINLGSLLMREADKVAAADPDRARQLRAEAVTHNLGALEQFEQLQHPRGIAMAADNAGTGYTLLGEPAKALPLHRRSRELRERIGDSDGLLTSDLYIAAALISIGRHGEAKQHLDRASAAVVGRSLMLQAGVAEQWVRLEEARGRPADALARLRELNRIRDAIVAADHANRVAEIQARYDTAQQQRRIEALQNAQALAEATVSRQRTLLALSLAALTLLVLLLAVGVGWTRTRRRYAADMARAARTDELTGLANRREVRERVHYEIRRSRRSGRPFTIALLDIDGFKAVNDTYGHEVGDRVLLGVARRLEALLRRQDTIARWGGDELLALLPETSEAGGAALARKLADALAAAPFDVEGVAHRIEVTVGISQYWPGSTVDELVRAADDAMYRGKRAGKQRVVTSRD